MRLIPCLAVLLLPAALPAQDARVLARGRDLTRLFYESKTDSLWAQMAPAMRQALGSATALATLRTQVEGQLGAQATTLQERVMDADGHRTYLRTAKFEKAPVTIMVQWTLDSADKVAGFFIRPGEPPTEAASEFLARETKTPLHLPFTGDWFVFWGGRSIAQNYHAASVDQRFAYDLLIMKNGATHTGDGKRNEDYHCFGAPIVAPGPGIVRTAVDGIADNVPGVMNPAQPVGNHVVIDHGNGEYSVLAHFRRGTVKVRVGDTVRYGTALGECGNSGNSSEAHLHYHLQNSPVPLQGAGLPAQFLDYTADGRAVARGEPVKGQTIRP